MWAGVMLTAYLKTPQNTLDTMTKSVKTSHGQTLKSHGGVPNRRGCFGRQSGQKKKKKKNSRKKITCMKDLHKRYHNRKQRKSKSKPKTKTKKEPFQTSSWLQKYFSYFFKISKNVQHQGFFSFFFLQSHASTFIFIIIITLIWIIIWMIYRTVIIIVI